MARGIPKKALEVIGLLNGGADLEFRRTPQGYFRIGGKNKASWTKFERKTLLYAINAIHKNNLAEIQEDTNGNTKVILTGKGKEFAQKQKSILGSSTTPREWDKKWRLIFFDVPEQKKKLRDAFRYQLKKAGLKEFQRSAFIYPFSCFKEVEHIAGELNIKEHIVLVTAETLSNEFYFKNQFGLV